MEEWDAVKRILVNGAGKLDYIDTSRKKQGESTTEKLTAYI